MKTILITGGHIIDPARGVGGPGDIFLAGGKLARPAAEADITIDARGMLVTPGLIDLHVHFREPGEEDKETIATGAASAAAGGFTTVCTMANTNPPTDSAEGVRFVIDRASAAGAAGVLPVGAITRGRRGGEPADLEGMARAGAVAFSDDGSSVADAQVLRRAMEMAAGLGRPIISHCEDTSLAAAGVMHEGDVSRALHLPGIPAEAEEAVVARDIAIARETACRLHIAHVSTAGSVDIIRRAKAEGVAVTAEATPHHVSLTDECVRSRGGACKMKPPLRTAADVAAIKEGLADGTIECLASDHAPHGAPAGSFADAPFGIIGLESALAVYIAELVLPGTLSWPELIAAMSTNPARALGLKGKGTLAAGADADVTIIDPAALWTIDAGNFKSKSRNCPWHGREVRGKVLVTIVGGRLVHDARGAK